MIMQIIQLLLLSLGFNNNHRNNNPKRLYPQQRYNQPQYNLLNNNTILIITIITVFALSVLVVYFFLSSGISTVESGTYYYGMDRVV